MAAPTPTSASTWTAYPSLLPTLAFEQQNALERAGEARQCGRHSEARRVFDESFPDRDRVPLLMFEYADLLTDQGMEGERLAFLEQCQVKPQLHSGSEQKQLFRLMLADATMWASGRLQQAIDAARQARPWLRVEPTQPLSDLQIRGVQLYHQIMDRGLRDSRWVEPFEITALDSPARDLHSENSMLASVLKSQGRLAPAARFTVDVINTADSASLPTLSENAAAFCDELDATNSPPLMYRAAHTRMTLAARCPHEERALAAQCRLTVVSQLTRLASSQDPPKDWQTYAPRIYTRLQIESLTSALNEASESSLASLDSLEASCLAREDGLTASLAIEAVIGIRAELATQQPSQEHLEGQRTALMRHLLLHREMTRSLYQEALALMELLLLANFGGQAYEDVLDAVTSFQARAPAYDVPVMLERIYSLAKAAARSAGRQDLFDRFDALHSEAIDTLNPEPWRAPTRLPDVITRIMDNAHTILDYGRNAVEIALLWSADEVRSGELSELEWGDMFGFYTLRNQDAQPLRGFTDFLDRVISEYRRFSEMYFQTSREEWPGRLQSIRTWLSGSTSTVPLSSRNTVLDKVAQGWAFKQRSDWMQTIHTDEENADFLQQMLADTELAQRLGSLGVTEPTSMATLPTDIEARSQNVFAVLAQLKTANQDLVTAEMLDKAIADSQIVFDECRRRKKYLHMFHSMRRQGELLYNKQYKFQTATLDDALASLQRAVDVYDEVRRRRSVPLAQHYAVTAKMQQLREYDAADVYAKAICWSRFAWNQKVGAWNTFRSKSIPAIELAAARRDREARVSQLRDVFEASYASFLLWTQRSKGRALLDLLGIDAPIPRAVLEKCNEDQTAVSMLTEERGLLQRLEQSSFPESTGIQQDIDALRMRMRAHPALAEVMRIRDGAVISAKETMALLDEVPDHVILVDFVYVDFDKPIRALCYRRGLVYFPVLMPALMMDTLKAWTTKNIDHARKPLSDLAAAKAALAELTPLLQPLFALGGLGMNQGLGPIVRPDDTIVFCPTGVLHSLPLHAVSIDGAPIIEKHPVIYSPNVTMLRHCFRNLHASSPYSQSDQAPKRVVMNTMPSHWPGKDHEPVTSIAESRRLSSTLNATFIQGCDHKKDEAKSALNGAAVFHYHGHAQFVRDAAMRSYLVLDGRGPSDPGLGADLPEPSTSRRAGRGGQSPPDRHLTAEDIFGCTMAKGGALATLVGCRSGGADVSAADDVLGLPMALHYAGATAVVSSLWRLEDEDGAAWAESFYGTLIKERETSAEPVGEARISQADAGGEQFTNLARAMQQAVGKLRFDADGNETAPYHWAGYVLSGYWMLSTEVFR